jgi:integrase
VESAALDLGKVVDHLNDPFLDSVTLSDLRHHVGWLKNSRHNRPSSLRRKIATIKGLFAFAASERWIAEDEARGLVYPPPSRPQIVALDDDELDRVVASATNDPVWLAVVLLLSDAGLKRDEVLALEAEDLDLARHPADSLIHIRHALHAKRPRRRQVPITTRLHTALTRLLIAPMPRNRLFSLSVRGLNFVVETVGQRAGAPKQGKLTPEVLRDTYAVSQMRLRVRAEAAEAGRGANADVLARLRKQHDLQVLDLLGLSRLSDAAARYRAQAARSEVR